ncbi:MAG: hypothetical protein H0U71_08680 [Gammaproteobacteria bacterium]|nr:hypothetical protein [Gammaproteobacteria bacterium]
MAILNFFNPFHRKNNDTDDNEEITLQLLQEQIAKAVNLIKVMHYDSSFPEIAFPDQGGYVEVAIEQDENNPEVFHVQFCFITLPKRDLLFQQQKDITYFELKNFVREYDNNKEEIDQELQAREAATKNLNP